MAVYQSERRDVLLPFYGDGCGETGCVYQGDYGQQVFSRDVWAMEEKPVLFQAGEDAAGSVEAVRDLRGQDGVFVCLFQKIMRQGLTDGKNQCHCTNLQSRKVFRKICVFHYKSNLPESGDYPGR